jgi:MFS transporter, ACDE family, multidrug resistance protein
MLGCAPFPLELSASQLGFVFFGWGLLVAFFSVVGAPWIQRRYGTARSRYAALLFFAADLAVISIFVNNRTVLVVAVITAGIFIGINNTLTTQAVMMVSSVERPVASAAYGFVRFLGAGLAPFVAGKLVERFNVHVPFAIGALQWLWQSSCCPRRARCWPEQTLASTRTAIGPLSTVNRATSPAR